VLISVVIFLMFFAFIPSVVFQRLEGWTFGEGVYYAMITLTTIGLGDYEAGLIFVAAAAAATKVFFYYMYYYYTIVYRVGK